MRGDSAESSGKISVAFEPELLRRAKERANQLGYRTSFSAYIGQLVRIDLEEAAREAAAGEREARQPKAILERPGAPSRPIPMWKEKLPAPPPEPYRSEVELEQEKADADNRWLDERFAELFVKAQTLTAEQMKAIAIEAMQEYLSREAAKANPPPVESKSDPKRKKG